MLENTMNDGCTYYHTCTAETTQKARYLLDSYVVGRGERDMILAVQCACPWGLVTRWMVLQLVHEIEICEATAGDRIVIQRETRKRLYYWR